MTFDESKADRNKIMQISDVQCVRFDEETAQRNTCLKYAKLILPHVGLIVLSCLYIGLGASVFYHLEQPNELRTRHTNLQTINERKHAFLTKLWNLSDVSEEEWRKIAAEDVDFMADILFNAFDTHYIDATHLANESDTKDVWSFAAAVFFSSTLLTTIGYGNLVPVTFEGRVFCVCYGLFGVPLILITVTDIGKFFAEHITLIYSRYDKWKKRSRLFRRISTMRQTSVEDQRNQLESDDSMTKELSSLGLGFVNIPTPLILTLLLGYMASGAMLLSFLEGWHFFDAFYFSFITMTTVGFGDLVPHNEKYFFLDLLYIVVGLAITTMCIDLVGARYIEKIHYFGVAIQDVRVALVNVGGKMVQVSDLKKYAAFLHRKYGLALPDEGKRRMGGVENPFPDAFTPRGIKGIRYIDFVASSESLHSYHSKSDDEREIDRRWRMTYGLE